MITALLGILAAAGWGVALDRHVRLLWSRRFGRAAAGSRDSLKRSNKILEVEVGRLQRIEARVRIAEASAEISALRMASSRDTLRDASWETVKGLVEGVLKKAEKEALTIHREDLKNTGLDHLKYTVRMFYLLPPGHESRRYVAFSDPAGGKDETAARG